MAQSSVQIACIVSQPFAENSFIANLSQRQDCLIFDPGFDPEAIISHVDHEQLTPAAIINTHGHSDHIAGNQAMKDRWPECPLIIGAGDESKLTDPNGNLSAPFGAALVSPPADQTVSEGDVIEFAGIRLEVRETPGHSSGHVVFIWKEESPHIVFGGDVLFRGSVGRTDFPDSDGPALVQSIKQKLFTLPGDTIVLPGHGESTTVEFEKQNNPFVGEG